MNEEMRELYTALRDAFNHLEWSGYGDNYERECAVEGGLPNQLASVLDKYSYLDEEKVENEKEKKEKKPKYINPKKYIFNFGKHLGEKFDDVKKVDPNYLLWCHENVKWFEMDDKTRKEVANIYEQKVGKTFEEVMESYIKRNVAHYPDDEPF